MTEQGAATQEIARGVEVAAERTVETANQVNLMGQATQDTRSSATTVKPWRTILAASPAASARKSISSSSD